MADRYWVGGSGNWSDDDNHWATSSGGAPADGNLPTASDNVFFDSNSHTTNYTVTIDATTKLCNDLNFAAPATGNVTLAGSVQITISGSLTLYSGLVRTYTGALLFNSTASGETLTFAGTTMASATTFNGAGGEWTVQDTWDNGSSNITVTSGTFLSNGQTVTCGAFTSSGSTTRVITLGASTMNVNSWNFQVSTNLTFNANTSVINVAGATNFFGGVKTYNTVNFTDTTTNNGPNLRDSNTFATLTRTNTSGYTQLILSADQTVTGTLTITGNNANTQRIWVGNSDSNIGTTRTITVTGATVNFTNVDFADTVISGATPTSTSVGDCGGNTGINATAAVTRYWVHGATASVAWSATTNWSTSSGGAGGASVPLPQDTATFDSQSFAVGTGKTVTLGVQNFRIPTVDWTNVTNSPTLSVGGGVGTPHVFGSFILISDMTFSAANLVFKGRGNYLLTTAGQTFASTTLAAPTGKVTLQDAYSGSGTITLDTGEWDGNDMSVTTANLVITGALTRTMRMGNGTYSLTGTGNVINAQTGTGLTLVPEGSTIKLTNSSITTKTFFSAAGLTYNNFWNDTGSTGLVNFTGSNTFNDFKISATERTTQFTAGTTTTATTWTISGAATDLNTIKSITSATHTLAKAGGGTVCADYLDLAYSIGSPASTFYAGANSTDSGNNSGWTFTACPGSATRGTCLMMTGMGS